MSYPGMPPKMAMQENMISSIYSHLKRPFDQSKQMQWKFHLFKLMYLSGNGLIMQMLIHISQNFNKYGFSSQQQQKINQLKDFKKFIQNKSFNILLTCDLNDPLVKLIFAKTFKLLISDDDIEKINHYHLRDGSLPLRQEVAY